MWRAVVASISFVWFWESVFRLFLLHTVGLQYIRDRPVPIPSTICAPGTVVLSTPTVPIRVCAHDLAFKSY